MLSSPLRLSSPPFPPLRALGHFGSPAFGYCPGNNHFLKHACDPREFMGASQNRFVYSRVQLLSVRPEIHKTLNSVSPLKRENEWFTEITGIVLLPAEQEKKTLSGYTGVCNLGLWHPIKFEIRKTSELTEGILSCLTWTTCLFCGEIQYNHEGARTQMGHCNWWRVWTETKAEGSSLSRWGAELGCRSHRLARLLLRITTLSLKRSAIELSLMADFLNSLKYTHTHTCTHTERKREGDL